MKSIALLAFLFLADAHAVVRPGTYQGHYAHDPSATCTINFKSAKYTARSKHALHMQVDAKVTYNSKPETITLRHPLYFRHGNERILFAHDHLHGAMSYPGGALGLNVHIGDDQIPRSFRLTFDNWRPEEGPKTLECQELAYKSR